MGFVSRGLVMAVMVTAIFAAGNRESSAAERHGDHCVAVDTAAGNNGTAACRGPVCRVFAARPVQRIVEAQPVRRAFAARPIRRLLARAPVRNFLFRRCY